MEISLDVNLDIISNLPANVTDQILVRLPIIDAVRTSVLSTKWRYRWTTITQLVFHDNNNNSNNSNDKFINLINLVLLLHNGFIHKFELSTKCLPISSSIIDAWILFLSRKNIKELVLQFSADLGMEPYKLPSCFFSAQKITTLELHWCVLKPPPATFTGFSYLKSLYLHKTTFVDKGGFECLISKCPLLERLTLISCILGHDNLNICSPNLKYLCIDGRYKDICFENTPLLSDVSINTDYLPANEVKKFLQSETGNLVKVFSSLPKLRKFMGEHFFVQFLSMGKIPKKLPFTCHHLNNLTLRLNFEDVNAICVTLCLLNSSPNLLQLEMISFGLSEWCHKTHNSENFWEGRSLVDWNMSGLQIVKITNLTGFELELDFIKLLLANSPMLEMLSIGLFVERDNDRKVQFLKELLIFPRASPKAKIKFLEKHEK